MSRHNGKGNGAAGLRAQAAEPASAANSGPGEPVAPASEPGPGVTREGAFIVVRIPVTEAMPHERPLGFIGNVRLGTKGQREGYRRIKRWLYDGGARFPGEREGDVGRPVASGMDVIRCLLEQIGRAA